MACIAYTRFSHVSQGYLYTTHFEIVVSWGVLASGNRRENLFLSFSLKKEGIKTSIQEYCMGFMAGFLPTPGAHRGSRTRPGERNTLTSHKAGLDARARMKQTGVGCNLQPRESIITPKAIPRGIGGIQEVFEAFLWPTAQTPGERIFSNLQEGGKSGARAEDHTRPLVKRHPEAIRRRRGALHNPCHPLCGGAKENGFPTSIVIPSDFSNSFFRGTFFLRLWFLLSEKYFGGDFRNAFILRAGFLYSQIFFSQISQKLFFLNLAHWFSLCASLWDVNILFLVTPAYSL